MINKSFIINRIDLISNIFNFYEGKFLVKILRNTEDIWLNESGVYVVGMEKDSYYALLEKEEKLSDIYKDSFNDVKKEFVILVDLLWGCIDFLLEDSFRFYRFCYFFDTDRVLITDLREQTDNSFLLKFNKES